VVEVCWFEWVCWCFEQPRTVITQTARMKRGTGVRMVADVHTEFWNSVMGKPCQTFGMRLHIYTIAVTPRR